MKNELYNQLIDSINNFQKTINAFFSDVNLPLSSIKKTKDIKKEWSEIVKSINKMQHFFSPIEEYALKAPDGITEEFIELWSIYKDYLYEHHGIICTSRMEYFRLEIIFQYTNNNAELACEYLKFYMTGYQNIFRINPINLKNFKKEDINNQNLYDFNQMDR